MYAVGHLAWGYLAGRASSRALGIEANGSALLLAALLPDLDLALRGVHRGATHSLLLVAVTFTAALAIWGLRVLPYFVALAQHGLIDAFDQMGVQLFWPLTMTHYSLAPEPMGCSVLLAAEWTGFLLSLTLMLRTREFTELLKPDPTNLLAVVPIGALLFNVFVWHLPHELIVPTISYLGIVSLPVLADLRAITRHGSRRAAVAE